MDSANADSDGQGVDSQRKQSRIRHSLADLFSRVKRNMPGPTSSEVGRDTSSCVCGTGKRISSFAKGHFYAPISVFIMSNCLKAWNVTFGILI